MMFVANETNQYSMTHQWSYGNVTGYNVVLTSHKTPSSLNNKNPLVSLVFSKYQNLTGMENCLRELLENSFKCRLLATLFVFQNRILKYADNAIMASETFCLQM